MWTARLAAGLVGLALWAVIVGCAGSSSTPPTQPEFTGTTKGEPGGNQLTPELAKGREVFIAQNCGNCHMIHGAPVGTSKGGKAPDLGTVGLDRSHTVAWIADHIKNPKSHKPMSKMPAYEGKINEADLKSLSEYLASLK